MNWSTIEMIQFLQGFRFLNEGAGIELALTMIKAEFRDKLVDLAREMGMALGKRLVGEFKFIS